MGLLLKHSWVDVNSKDNYGKTPLAVAVEEGYGVSALLELEEAQAYSRTIVNATPLALAAERGH